MRHKFLVALVLSLCLGLMASSAFAVNFIVNPGFEDGTGNAAPPWSYWGGSGGAVANTYVNAANSTPRVWSNFGNPTYVNVASQNEFNDVWMLPGTTYRVSAQWYVPSSEVLPGITPRAGIYMTNFDGTFFRMLDPRYPDNPDNPMSPVVPTDQWYTTEFDWVCPGAVGDAPIRCNYMSFRMYGGDGSAIQVNNPGMYIDNCVFSSDAYTGVIDGVVKDANGPLAGASVQVIYQGVALATIETDATGIFSVGTLIPGEEYTVTVTKTTYAGQSIVTAASASLGDIVLGPDPSYDPDILFNVLSSSLTGNPGDLTGPWPTVNPSGVTLATIGTPTIAEINGQKWELNKNNEGDGFRFVGPVNSQFDQPIPVNGATVVAAVRPIRYGSTNNW